MLSAFFLASIVLAAPKPAAVVAPESAPAAAAPVEDHTDVEQAKKYFQWAQRLYKQAQYAEAITKFEEAYRLKPHPVIFFNVGRCYEQLGDIPRALRNYRDYLRLAPQAMDREAVSDAMANLERRLREQGVQQLMIFAEPSLARIEVDGKDLGTSPVSVELAAGNHRVNVKLKGYEPVERSFVMSTQRATELSFVLKPEAVVVKPPEVAVVPPPVLVKPPEKVPPNLELKAAPAPSKPPALRYAAYGLGALAAGAGGFGALQGLSASAEATRLKGDPAATPAAWAGVMNRAQVADFSYIGAGVCGASALVIYLLTSGDSAPSVAPGAGASGAAAFTF